METEPEATSKNNLPNILFFLVMLGAMLCIVQVLRQPRVDVKGQITDIIKAQIKDLKNQEDTKIDELDKRFGSHLCRLHDLSKLNLYERLSCE